MPIGNSAFLEGLHDPLRAIAIANSGMAAIGFEHVCNAGRGAVGIEKALRNLDQAIQYCYTALIVRDCGSEAVPNPA